MLRLVENIRTMRKDYCGAAEILRWGMQTLSGLRSSERVSFLDKIDATLLACLAAAQVKNGNAEPARQILMHARAMAERFDENPDYHVTALRFIASGEQAGVYDDLGTSALESVERMLASMEDAALDAHTAYQVTNDVLSLENMTRIVVTHALKESLLRRYDAILVMKNGEIVERGSFDALMAQDGYFRALYTVSQ